VLPRDYDTQACSLARTLEIVGERWTPLILRDAFLGLRRFDDFQRNLGIARNVLTVRLQRLCDEGILERVRYQERPVRHEYRLTDKGRDLWPVLITLTRWGDRHAAPDGPPRLLTHRGCGGEITERLRCDRCGQDLEAGDVDSRRGPGAGERVHLADARAA
jgi:DNA-binding HxlR family transcriptional regulator